MASGREIVSLQFGSYSNFIGTHWWNLQVSVTNFVPFQPSHGSINGLTRRVKALWEFLYCSFCTS
jgi:hypothetical protein